MLLLSSDESTTGFSVIQAVVLSENDGIRRKSALGLTPFVEAIRVIRNPPTSVVYTKSSGRQLPAVCTSLSYLRGGTN